MNLVARVQDLRMPNQTKKQPEVDHVEETLLELVASGDAEVSSIGENGELFYRITPKGIAKVEKQLAGAR